MPRDLETLVQRELHRLTPPGAPPTLLPRVMAAVRAWAARPWYQRAWFTWPLMWRVVALLLLLTFGTAAILGAETTLAMVADTLGGVADRFGSSFSRARVAIFAVSGVARALLEPAIVYRAYTFLFIVAMCAACAALASALQRMSTERTRVS